MNNIGRQIELLIQQKEHQKSLRESEPKAVRLEPRQILSVSIVSGDTGGVYAKLKPRLFNYPEIVISDDEFDRENRIESEIPSPYWADNKIRLFWVRHSDRRLICVRIRLDENSETFFVSTQSYIRVHYKPGMGGDLMIYPEDRGKFCALRTQIEEMIKTDKPIWINV